MSGCLYSGCVVGVPACAGSWTSGLMGPNGEVSGGVLKTAAQPTHLPTTLSPEFLTNPPRHFKACHSLFSLWTPSSCSVFFAGSVLSFLNSSEYDHTQSLGSHLKAHGAFVCRESWQTLHWWREICRALCNAWCWAGQIHGPCQEFPL